MDNTYYLDTLDETWQEFYDQDIIAGIPNASQASLVLGGETAMWGETVVRIIEGFVCSRESLCTANLCCLASRMGAISCRQSSRGQLLQPSTSGATTQSR